MKSSICHPDLCVVGEQYCYLVSLYLALVMVERVRLVSSDTATLVGPNIVLTSL